MSERRWGSSKTSLPSAVYIKIQTLQSVIWLSKRIIKMIHLVISQVSLLTSSKTKRSSNTRPVVSTGSNTFPPASRVLEIVSAEISQFSLVYDQCAGMKSAEKIIRWSNKFGLYYDAIIFIINKQITYKISVPFSLLFRRLIVQSVVGISYQNSRPNKRF